MWKLSIKKLLFTFSGIGVIAIFVMLYNLYNADAAVKAGTTFGDWSVVCEKDNNSKKETCVLAQVLSTTEEAKDKKSEPKVQRVAEFRVGYFNGEKTLKMVQILPFGTSLQAGTAIIINKDKIVAPGKFTICQPFGCMAVAELNKDIDAITSSDQAVYVGIVAADGKAIHIPLSTKGLNEGIAALKSGSK